MTINPIFYLAAFWGFGEATLFFLVPDILLSFVALRDLRLALKLSFIAALFATFGGVLMYGFGFYDESLAFNLLSNIPAIDFKLIQLVQVQIAELGYFSLLQGAFSGVPYKIYAVNIGALHQGPLDLLLFLLVSVPARFVRFILSVFVSRIVSNFLSPYASVQHQTLVFCIFWVVFYAVYFQN
ncbi:hypothetical protein JNK13_01795 [bacterium]|nr:hypothetical protein [bacterium]